MTVPVPTTTGAGNTIVNPPVAWHTFLIAGVVIGATVWIVEQNVDDKAAMLLAIVLLLGVIKYSKNFVSELQALKV